MRVKSKRLSLITIRFQLFGINEFNSQKDKSYCIFDTAMCFHKRRIYSQVFIFTLVVFIRMRKALSDSKCE